MVVLQAVGSLIEPLIMCLEMLSAVDILGEQQAFGIHPGSTVLKLADTPDHVRPVEHIV